MTALESGLGAAALSPDELAEVVARYFRVRAADVTVTAYDVTQVDYDIPAITTAARHWVSGEAEVDGESSSFRIFVKQVQAWSRHPYFQFVPEEMRDFAAASVPWRTEALVYRSDLHERLPDGLTMPRAVHVADLDSESAAIWLEEVPVRDVLWDLDRYERAAHLLGRMAGSSRVAPLARVGEFEWDVLNYVNGRLLVDVVPTLRSPELWEHPLTSPFTPLRERLLAAADLVTAYGEELVAMPHLPGHGDACPNNLLAGVGDELVLIDFGFWMDLPVGYDLGQLLVGDVQLGLRPAELLAETEAAILPAYVEGLRTEGSDIPEETVRRAHALHLVLWTGLSSLPLEQLSSPVTPDLERLAAERAELGRFCLDLLDATGG